MNKFLAVASLVLCAACAGAKEAPRASQDLATLADSGDVALADALSPVDAAEPADAQTADVQADLEPVDAPADVSPMHPQFAFAIIADPHVVGTGENFDRLQKAVAWINAERASRGIALVLVLGDLGWGSGGGLGMAQKILDKLEIPYVPIVGDNEVVFGSEEEYDTLFAPHYAELAKQLQGFERAPTPTVDPADGKKSWFQNLAFDYGGVRFVGLDWAARVPGEIASEQGDLHDYPGATFPWLVKQMAALGQRPDESVVLFTHIPMHESPGGFMKDEWKAIVDVIAPVGHLVSAAFGGHYHFDYEQLEEDAGMTLYVTASPFNGPLRVRVVKVLGNGAAFAYEHELIDVPFP